MVLNIFSGRAVHQLVFTHRSDYLTSLLLLASSTQEEILSSVICQGSGTVKGSVLFQNPQHQLMIDMEGAWLSEVFLQLLKRYVVLQTASSQWDPF